MPPPVVADTDLSRPSPTKIGIGPVNLEVALPRWAITAISSLTILSATGVGGYTTFVNLNAAHQKQIASIDRKADDRVNSVLIPADQMRVFAEQNKHQTDQEPADKEVKKETLEAADGSVEITHFLHDGCVQVIRRRPGQDPQSKWIFGTVGPTANAGDSVPPITLPNPSGITLVSSPAAHTQQSAGSGPHLQNAILNRDRPAALRTTGYAGRCLNPHPGTFTPRNAKIDQCNVIQTRTYADGCVNTQRFNTCNGSWEVNQDGSPRVNWTNCVH